MRVKVQVQVRVRVYGVNREERGEREDQRHQHHGVGPCVDAGQEG